MLLLLAFLSPPPFQPLSTVTHPAAASPVHRTFWLTGSSNWGWNLTQQIGPQLEVYDRDNVTLMLIKHQFDGITHNWFLDFNNNFVVDSNEQATSSLDFSSTTQYTNFTFTVTVGGNIPGTGSWNYRCKYHPTSMFGVFTVVSTAPDFAVTSTPASLTVVRGSSNTSTIRAVSVNNFMGSVTLSTTVSPGGGPTAVLGLGGLVVPAGSSNSTGLTVSTTASTPTGSYTISVTASNSTVSRSTQVSVTVVEAVSQPSTPPVPTLIFAGVIGAGVIFLAVAALALARRRKGKNKPSSSP